MDISKIKINGTSYTIKDTTYSEATTNAAGLMSASDKTKVNSIPSSGAVFTDTKYKLTLNGTTNGDNAGTSLGSFYAPTSAGTSGQVLKSNGSGVEWGTVSSSVSYTDVSYGTPNTITAASTTVSLAGTTPQHVVSFSSAITGVTLSANPTAGHSCHVMFVNTGSADLTVTITHDSTNRICPGAADLTLTAKAGGYAEVDFLNIDSKIYVRGV